MKTYRRGILERLRTHYIEYLDTDTGHDFLEWHSEGRRSIAREVRAMRREFDDVPPRTLRRWARKHIQDKQQSHFEYRHRKLTRSLLIDAAHRCLDFAFSEGDWSYLNDSLQSKPCGYQDEIGDCQDGSVSAAYTYAKAAALLPG